MSRRINRRNALKAAVAGVGCAHLPMVGMDARAQEIALSAPDFLDTNTIPADLRALGIDEELVRKMTAVVKGERFGSCEEVSPLPDDRETSASFAFQQNSLNESRAARAMVASGLSDADPRRVASAFTAGDPDVALDRLPAEAILDDQRIWNASKEITWCFVSPSSGAQASLISQACTTAFSEWAQILNCVRIRNVADNTNAPFSSGNPDASNRASIRISMVADGSYRSLVGTDSRRFNLDNSGLNASLNMSPSSNGLQLSEYTRLARHEVGHALGLLHEHQHGLDPILWKLPELYAYFFAKYRWGQAQTKSQVVDKALVAANFATAQRDDRSIMHYWYPRTVHNTPNVPETPNVDFSTVDRTFARQKYQCGGPGPEDPVTQDPRRPDTANVVRRADLPVNETGRVGEEIRTPGDAVLYTVRIETAGTYHFETIDNPSITMKLTLFDRPDMTQPPRASNHHGGARLLNARIIQENLPVGTYYVLAEHYYKTRSSIGKFDIRAYQP